MRTKNLVPYFLNFEIYGDVGLAITNNFLAQIYLPLYLLPISYDDSLHRWLVYVRVSITSVVLLYLSEFRLIQPLRWDFSFTLTHNKVIRIASYFILKVPSPTTIVGYCQHLAEYQLTTSLGADCLMGFLWLPIIQPIPYRVNYSPYFSKFQIVKKLLCHSRHII